MSAAELMSATGTALEDRAHQKSFKRKYKKLRHTFKEVMRRSDDLFKQEKLAERAIRRMQEENTRLLDLLVDLNNSTHISKDRRHNIGSPSRATPPRFLSPTLLASVYGSPTLMDLDDGVEVTNLEEQQVRVEMEVVEGEVGWGEAGLGEIVEGEVGLGGVGSGEIVEGEVGLGEVVGGEAGLGEMVEGEVGLGGVVTDTDQHIKVESDSNSTDDDDDDEDEEDDDEEKNPAVGQGSKYTSDDEDDDKEAYLEEIREWNYKRGIAGTPPRSVREKMKADAEQEQKDAELQAKKAAEEAAAELQAKKAAEKAAAELQAKKAAERAAAELRAKKAAERAAAELRAKKAAEKAAAELRAKKAAEEAVAELQSNGVSSTSALTVKQENEVKVKVEDLNEIEAPPQHPPTSETYRRGQTPEHLKDPGPLLMTPEEEENWYTEIDAIYHGDIPPLECPNSPSAPKAEGDPRNPMSVYCWLRKNQPQVFLQGEEAEGKRPRGRGGRRKAAEHDPGDEGIGPMVSKTGEAVKNAGGKRRRINGNKTGDPISSRGGRGRGGGRGGRKKADGEPPLKRQRSILE